MKKITVILENAPDFELGRATVDVTDEGDQDAISLAIQDAIEAWILSPGDTIKIGQVS